jgi:hypothetical protein
MVSTLSKFGDLTDATQNGNTDVIGVMDRRLRTLLARVTVSHVPISHSVKLRTLTTGPQATGEVASGWRRLTLECGWKANPIGCFVPPEGDSVQPGRNNV